MTNHSPLDVPDGTQREYVPLPHQVQDWEVAQTMIKGLELRGPLYERGIVADTPEDPIVIIDHTGAVLFAVRDDGTVEAPNIERLPEAAVIFWRNVLELARLSGLTIKEPFGGVN